MSQLQREKCVTGWWAIGMSYLCTPGMTSNLRLANASTFNTLLHDVAWCYMPLLTVGIVSRTVFFSKQMTAAHGSSPDHGLIWLDEPLVETLAWQPAARPEAWITALAYTENTENTENIPIITKDYQTHQNKKGNLKRHVNATWTPPFLPWRLRRPNLRNLLHYKLLRISILYIYIIHNVSHIHLASPYKHPI